MFLFIFVVSGILSENKISLPRETLTRKKSPELKHQKRNNTTTTTKIIKNSYKNHEKRQILKRYNLSMQCNTLVLGQFGDNSI